jgi:hypothetical protein
MRRWASSVVSPKSGSEQMCIHPELKLRGVGVDWVAGQVKSLAGHVHYPADFWGQCHGKAKFR